MYHRVFLILAALASTLAGGPESDEPKEHNGEKKLSTIISYSIEIVLAKLWSVPKYRAFRCVDLLVENIPFLQGQSLSSEGVC